MNKVFIGRYQVLEELGRGGMGIVYRCVDPALDRPVAIKVLPPKKLTQPEAIKRFLREARLCARLDHPNIIKIHDIGQEEGIYHIVMELVEGNSLRNLIESRSSIRDIDIDRMMEIFAETCEAVAYAHSKEIIHRDLKPDNIMLTGEGRVKVMDFGLAVLENRHSLTEMGQVMGTVAYFSPEQAKGEPADQRSDIYSLGAVFFEMLTNQLVFDAKSPGDMIVKVLTSPSPSPKVYNPSIPPLFTNLIHQCLKKNPAERLQNVYQILEILNQWRGTRKNVLRGAAEVLRSKPEKPASPPAEPIKIEEKDMRELAVMLGGGTEDGAVSSPEKPAASDGDTWDNLPRGSSFALSPKGGIPTEEVSRKKREVTKIPVHTHKTEIKKGDTLGSEGEGWVKQAAHKDKEWEHYQKRVLEKMKKDESAIGHAGAEEGRVLCPRCGCENDVSRKYCSDCGHLMSQETFKSEKEAVLYNDQGKEFLEKNIYNKASRKFMLAVEKDPNFVEAWLNLGKALTELKLFKDARGAYRSAAGVAKESPEPYIFIGDLYKLENRNQEALESYQKALEIDPSDLKLRFQVAQLCSQAGGLDESIEHLNKILKMNPADLSAHRLLGHVYVNKNFLKEAVSEYETVVRIDPDDEESAFTLEGLYKKVGRPVEAEAKAEAEELAKAVLAPEGRRDERIPVAEPLDSSANDSIVETHKRLADIYIQQNRVDLARTQLEGALVYRTSDPEIHEKLGDIYLNSREIDKALLHMEKTVTLNPNNSKAYYKLGKIYGQKNYGDLSVASFKKAVELEPYKPQYREDLSLAYYSSNKLDDAINQMKSAAMLDATNMDYQKALGVMYEEAGRLDEAEQQLKSVIRVNPNDDRSQGMLGQVYAKKGLTNMAVLQFQKALRLNPNSHLFYSALGKSLADQGRFDEAGNAFQKAIKLTPGGNARKGTQIHAKTYADLGRVYLEQGDYKAALKVLKQALDVIPEDPKALHYMGVAYSEDGQYELAQQYLSKVLKLNPDNPESLRELADVYMRQDNFTLGLSLVRKSVDLAPDVVDGYELLAQILVRMGRYDEAQSALSEAVFKCSHDRDYAYWLKGWIAAQESKMEKAVEFYMEAISINAIEWSYYKDLGLALESLGRYEEALANFELAYNYASGDDSLSVREDMARMEGLLGTNRESQRDF